MIKQIKLFNHGYGLTDRRNNVSVRTWYLCWTHVRKHFDLPKNCNRVFFTAHARPAAGRVKLERKDGYIYIDGKAEYNWQMSTEDALLRLLKKHGDTFYVECEYDLATTTSTDIYMEVTS